jgi:hypothetical protein
MTTKMRKLIIVLLCLFVHFADAQRRRTPTSIPQRSRPTAVGLPTPPKPLGSNTTKKDSTINGILYTWYKGGYVARDHKIVLLDRNSAKYKRLGKDKLLISFRQSYANQLQIPIDSVRVLKSCDCDEELYLLGATNLHSVAVVPDPDGSSGGNDAQDPPTGTTGYNDNSINTNKIDSVNKSDSSKKPTVNTCKLDMPVKVAYIDGGVDQEDPSLFASYLHFFYLNEDFNKKLSNPEKIYGYNFTDFIINQNIQEVGECKHGVNISHIFMGELRDVADNDVKVMPLKIFKNGKGNLFDALCAILYAQKNRFEIINCSWGHKGAENPVFKKIMKSLEADKIMVIASAGNDCQELGANGYGHYPAMFSREFSNVISVSTVIDPPSAQPTLRVTNGLQTECSPDNICGNYGSNYVNVGYRGGTNFEVKIRDKFFVDGRYITINPQYGTSYSTAHITGMLANNYLKYLNIRRSNIMSTGNSPSIKSIFLSDTSLFDFDTTGYHNIQDGRINKR